MNLEDYEDLFFTFMAAKEARNEVLAPIRERLDEAQREWAEAMVCPESAAYEQARAELTRFRRRAAAEGIQLHDPRKERDQPDLDPLEA